ncbi:hypothetical protein AB1Y20_005688, partial [Prymnesium parvum]
MAGVLSLELVQATDEVEITGERKNMRWTRELDTVLLRQILATGVDAFMTSRHNTKNMKYDQSKTWQGPGGIIPTLQQSEDFKGLKLPTYQSIINHVTCSPHGLLAKHSHLFTPGKEQAEPAPANTEGTKDERPLGKFETLIIEVSELYHEAKKLEKEKKDGVEADAAESARRDEDMQSESVKRKYGGVSEDELKGSRSNRKKARQARLSDSDSSGNAKKKIRLAVADYCDKHPNASYSDIILGGSNVVVDDQHQRPRDHMSIRGRLQRVRAHHAQGREAVCDEERQSTKVVTSVETAFINDHMPMIEKVREAYEEMVDLFAQRIADRFIQIECAAEDTEKDIMNKVIQSVSSATLRRELDQAFNEFKDLEDRMLTINTGDCEFRFNCVPLLEWSVQTSASAGVPVEAPT